MPAVAVHKEMTEQWLENVILDTLAKSEFSQISVQILCYVFNTTTEVERRTETLCKRNGIWWEYIGRSNSVIFRKGKKA
jgi:hypothetical protein